MQRVKRLRKRLEDDKRSILAAIRNYLAELADDHEEAWKGNARLYIFDKKFKIEFRRRDRIELGPELNIAVAKIETFIDNRKEGADPAILAIVRDKITRDENKTVSVHDILSLRKFNFKDDLWDEAMDLIDEAIDIVATKDYLNFYERDEDGKYQPITLTFSAI